MKALHNLLAFIPLFLLLCVLQDHVLKITNTSAIMFYGYFGVRICGLVADTIFPTKEKT